MSDSIFENGVSSTDASVREHRCGSERTQQSPAEPHLCKGRRPVPSFRASPSLPGTRLPRMGHRGYGIHQNHGMGLRPSGSGHAFPPVIEAAAAERYDDGSNTTRPSPLEVECAESLLEVIPGAEMVKSTEDGSAGDHGCNPPRASLQDGTLLRSAPTIRSTPMMTGRSARRRCPPAFLKRQKTSH